MAKHRKAVRRRNPHTLPIVTSLVVFLALFLTLYALLNNNTDLRSRADVPSQGIGSAVGEEMSASIRITQPRANEAVANPVTLKAEVGFTSPMKVQFWVDQNEVPVNEVYDPPFETSVELTSGRHKVHVIAFDETGNAKRSPEVSFLVR